MKFRSLIALVLTCLMSVSIVNANEVEANTSGEGPGEQPLLISTRQIFPDVAPGDWFHDDIIELYNRGFVAGFDDGTFGPARNITVAEAVTIASRIDAEYNAENTYESSDVANKVGGTWFSNALSYSYINSYVDYDSVENARNNINRYDVARLFAKMLNLSPSTTTDIVLADTSDLYTVAMFDAALVAGYTGQDGSRLYGGDRPITRAEFCVIANRVCEYIYDNNITDFGEPNEIAYTGNFDSYHVITNNNTLDYIEMWIKGDSLLIEGKVSPKIAGDSVMLKYGPSDPVKVLLDMNGEFTYTYKFNDAEKRSDFISLYAHRDTTMYYDSILDNNIYIEYDESDGYKFYEPKSYDSNAKVIKSANNSLDDKVKSNATTDVKNLALGLESVGASDIDNARIIHDWIASSIYYDVEMDKANKNANTTEILESRKASSYGYFKLMQEMLSCVGIDSDIYECTKLTIHNRPFGMHKNSEDDNTANGYILLMKVDGRVAICDVAWDCFNTVGTDELFERDFYRTYFDMSLETLSTSHKIHKVVD